MKTFSKNEQRLTFDIMLLKFRKHSLHSSSYMKKKKNRVDKGSLVNSHKSRKKCKELKYNQYKNFDAHD